MKNYLMLLSVVFLLALSACAGVARDCPEYSEYICGYSAEEVSTLKEFSYYVRYNPDFPEESKWLEDALVDAIASWNERLGQDLLSYGGENAEVIVSIDSGSEDGHAGYFWEDTREITIYAEQFENTPYSRFPRVWKKAVAHEIGHSLGLGHEDKGRSLMFPKIYSQDFEITNKSVELLKSIYSEIE